MSIGDETSGKSTHGHGFEGNAIFSQADAIEQSTVLPDTLTGEHNSTKEDRGNEAMETAQIGVIDSEEAETDAMLQTGKFTIADLDTDTDTETVDISQAAAAYSETEHSDRAKQDQNHGMSPTKELYQYSPARTDPGLESIYKKGAMDEEFEEVDEDENKDEDEDEDEDFTSNSVIQFKRSLILHDTVLSGRSSPFILNPEINHLDTVPSIQLQNYKSLTSPDKQNRTRQGNDDEELEQHYNIAPELSSELDELDESEDDRDAHDASSSPHVKMPAILLPVDTSNMPIIPVFEAQSHSQLPLQSKIYLSPQTTRENESVESKESTILGYSGGELLDLESNISRLDNSYDDIDLHFHLQRQAPQAPLRQISAKQQHQPHPFHGTAARTVTPWRKLRTSKMYEDFQFDRKSVISTSSVGNGANGNDISTSHLAQIEELNKQIVDYKIQIKFFKDYLQKLIRNSGESGQFAVNQLHSMFEENKKYKQLQQQVIELSEKIEKQDVEYNEIFKLNGDLYTSIEAFQGDINDRDNTLNKLLQQVAEWCEKLDVMLLQELDVPTVDERKNAELLTSRLDYLAKQLESLNLQKQQEGKHDSGEFSDKIEQLTDSVKSLKSQVSFHISNNDNLSLQLKDEILNSKHLKQNCFSISRKFNQIYDSIHLASTSDEGAENLLQENLRLKSLNKSVDGKLHEYQVIIDHLRDEVNNLKISTTATSTNNNRGEDFNSSSFLNQQQHEIELLNEELSINKEKYQSLQRETSKTIKTLSDQLGIRLRDLSIQNRRDKNAIERLKEELDESIGKQRILQAEKIRLTYSVDALNNEKGSLQALADKFQQAQQQQNIRVVEIETAIASRQSSTNTIVEVNDKNFQSIPNNDILEYQFEELFLYDITRFKKLLSSFVKIADDISLKDPRRKIEWLTKLVIEGEDQEHDEGNSHKKFREIVNGGKLKKLYQYHKSVFDYFVRAVDIIVHDHVRLLLKEGEEGRKKDEYITRLQERIEELNDINDALAEDEISGKKKNQASYFSKTLPNTPETPRTKLRLEELSNRWKAEREARVYENKASQKRLKELELENAKLRNQLARLS